MGKSGSEGRGEQTTARKRGTGGTPLTLLLEAESPEDGKAHPPERRLVPAPCSAMAFLQGHRNLRGVERCPVRAIKEMSRTPKSRSDVRQGRTRDQPSGREPQGDGRPIVVVEVATHQGGRESRPQGEGA